MTLEHIRIAFAAEEGALRRVLGLIEARGFIIRSMQMVGDDAHVVLTLAITPRDGSRRVAILLRQIERLHSVGGAHALSNAPPVVEVRHAAVA